MPSLSTITSLKLSPPDCKASVRILHRKMRMRTWDDVNAPCRFCDNGTDVSLFIRP